jgi:hypothetical protein
VTGLDERFPAYEVPSFVLDRYPRFDLTDPDTWPEPDKCTDGRPWGWSAYGGRITRREDADHRWRRYLDAVDRPRPAGARRSFVDRDLGCRNRWKDERYRLCGTHLRPFLDRIADQQRADRVRASTEKHLALAHRLAAHGIESDARAYGVLLQANAVEGLLRLLSRPETAAWPSTDLTIPPPL